MIRALLLCSCIALLPPGAYADTSRVYTQENFRSTPHEQPTTFTATDTGGFIGVTEGGRAFTQTPVMNDHSVRLHKFSIDESFHYISDRGVIFASDDLAALSVYFTRA